MEIQEKIQEYLERYVDHEAIREIMDYALFPGGKYFRPRLIEAFAKDVNCYNKAHLDFACAIEVHHTYTLVHDDLPSMDNDDMRRGKPSTHKKYGEWQALLIGDGLLNFSYQLLHRLPSEHLPKILKLFGEYAGANGLILGQFLDLSQTSFQSFDQSIRMHELKTARLIQLALLGANILSDSPYSEESVAEMGKIIGINFQLLDDLSELTEALSLHEQSVNLFLNFDAQMALDVIRYNHQNFSLLCKNMKLKSLKSLYFDYLKKMQKVIEANAEVVSNLSGLNKDDLRSIFESAN